MKNKGFTLVELIVIIIIIGVIILFALPNVTSTLERQKKDAMIVDAIDFVHKVKTYRLKYNKTGAGGPYYLKDIDTREEIIDSPFGNEYIRSQKNTENGCYVSVSVDGNEYKYEVKLQTSTYLLHSDDVNKLSKSKKYTLVNKKT